MKAGRNPARGSTLIEMLVTLAIVSFIAGLLGQALFQLSRIERLLESGQLQGMADAVRAAWVRNAIESLLPGAADSPDRLRGSERELQGLSAEVPQWPAQGLAQLHLRLVYREEQGVTQLQQLAAPAGASDAEPVVLLSWPGREGRLRYLDSTGQWQDRWPAASDLPGPALPRVIVLETGLPELRLVLAAPRASDLSLPTRRQFESM